MMLITTLVISFCKDGGVSVNVHYSSLTAPNLQHTINQERKDQCGNQHHSRELLMMGIVMVETCWAYKKYNKVISGIVGFLFFRHPMMFRLHDCLLHSLAANISSLSKLHINLSNILRQKPNMFPIKYVHQCCLGFSHVRPILIFASSCTRDNWQSSVSSPCQVWTGSNKTETLLTLFTRNLQHHLLPNPAHVSEMENLNWRSEMICRSAL